MIRLKGKYGTAKVFTSQINESSTAQIIRVMNEEWVDGANIAFMPDVHAGNLTPIGLTAIGDFKTISPELIGPDIGCGVSLFITDFEIDNNEEMAKWLEEAVKDYVPTGRNSHSTSVMTDFIQDYLIDNTFIPLDDKIEVIGKTLGTLGGGNHFIEAYNLEGRLVIAVHSGSRSLGGIVYNYYMKKSRYKSETELHNKTTKVINDYKSQGRETEIEDEIIRLRNEYNQLAKSNLIPYLTDPDDFEDYLIDVETTTEIASINRQLIFRQLAQTLMTEEEVENTRVIDKPHNFIERVQILNSETGEAEYKVIVRKGAQASYGGDEILIPINMRDGIIVGTTIDDMDLVERNYSMPHGAGRVYSRRQAKYILDLEDFKEQMKDVHSWSVGQSTLDEAPDAYKPIDQILDSVKGLIHQDSLLILKPFYNHKGK